MAKRKCPPKHHLKTRGRGKGTKCVRSSKAWRRRRTHRR